MALCSATWYVYFVCVCENIWVWNLLHKFIYRTCACIDSERQHIYDLPSEHIFGKPREYENRPCSKSNFRPPGDDAKQWSGVRWEPTYSRHIQSNVLQIDVVQTSIVQVQLVMPTLYTGTGSKSNRYCNYRCVLVYCTTKSRTKTVFWNWRRH